MDILSQFIDSLLNGKNSSKNIIITVILVVVLCLNFLGIDIKYLTNISYSTTTLIIINIVTLTVICGIIFTKLNNIYSLGSKYDESLKISEKIKEDSDVMETQLLKVLDNQQAISSTCITLLEELNGIPNIKFLKTIFELKIDSIRFNIFKECLTYSLTCNDTSQKIVLETFNENIKEIQLEFIDFMQSIMKKYSTDENVTEILNFKINNKIQLILDELQKEKKMNEKLYIISTLLKQLQDEMNEQILKYLQIIQKNTLLNR